MQWGDGTVPVLGVTGFEAACDYGSLPATEDDIVKIWFQLLTLFIIGPWLVPPAQADPGPPLSEEAIEERLAFIEARLNGGRDNARLWQYGWSSFFAANAALQGVQAIRSNNADNETHYTVDAIKSSAALALMLLRPLPAVEGAAPIEAMPAGTPAQKMARLKAAEELLRTNADRARERTSWSRHLTALAVNLIGGTAIAAIGDVKDAVTSKATGIAISQAQIWSQPWRAIDDLAEYEETFPAAPSTEALSWELTPIPGGLGVTIRF